MYIGTPNWNYTEEFDQILLSPSKQNFDDIVFHPNEEILEKKRMQDFIEAFTKFLKANSSFLAKNRFIKNNLDSNPSQLFQIFYYVESNGGIFKGF